MTRPYEMALRSRMADTKLEVLLLFCVYVGGAQGAQPVRIGLEWFLNPGECSTNVAPRPRLPAG